MLHRLALSRKCCKQLISDEVKYSGIGPLHEEAFPIRDHKAHTMEKVLLDRLFSRLGMPQELLYDQGSEFESKLVTEWCKALAVRKIRTSPCRPTTNGMLEGFNRTLNQMIGKVISENQRDWDEYVQPVMAA